MLYLSQIIGRSIRDRQNEAIATIKDLIVRLGEEAYPPVVGLIARTGARDFFVPWVQVAELTERGAKLSTFKVNLEPFARRDGEVLLTRDVLDKQLVDVNGRRVVRVNDLQLAPVDSEVRVVGVDVSPQAILRRLGPASLFGKLQSREIIDWANVEYLVTHAPAVRLKMSHERLSKLHPVDIARIIDSLSYHQGAEIVGSLDTATAADTIEEMSPERQVDIVEGMEEEKAADILEEMAPDEAADILAELSEEKAEDLLELMDEEEADDVRELMEYEEDTAGGIMTTDFAAIPSSSTVGEAIEHIRRLEEKPDFLFYVYVVESETDGRLVGAVSLRDLLLAEPTELIVDVMQRELRVGNADDSARDVARKIAEYNLQALPVVDDKEEILGVVTLDDAMEIILPEPWRRRLPKVFR
ncbi:MAG: magnesium transporter [Chloroflexi bacterium]|nr:magnesium transporter [Chloroflexota bacterium]